MAVRPSELAAQPEDEMTLMRWNPWSDIDTLQGELQKMLDTRTEGYRGAQVKQFQPTVDIYEDTDKYTLKFDLPEVKLDDAAQADELFTILMGEAVEPRRDFIQRNARDVRFLDI